MNIAKNMEIIFIVAVALIGSASFATAAAPVRHHGKPALLAKADAAAPMQVVTVSAKRMSAAEKAQLPM